MRTSRQLKGLTSVVIFAVLFNLALIGGTTWIVVHFVRKFW